MTRFLIATIALSALLVVGSAGAVPKPAPKFWSVARCERALPAEHPAIRQVMCVASGGPSSCRWTRGHRVRLYSEFTVFTRNRQRYVPGAEAEPVPGVVRSFTLSTRARPGFARIVHNYGDGYAGWPADFFTHHARLVATNVAAARFRSTVSPIAARLMDSNQAGNCTGG